MIGPRWDELSERLAEALESADPLARVAASGDPDLIEFVAWHVSAAGFLEDGRARRENPWLGQKVAGRYRLKSVLGRGGAGVVFEACDEQVAARRVVVKLLHDFWSSEDWMRRRFREEAGVLTQLDHPGIVRLIDAGEVEDGRLFLVLPFHEGRTLREALAAGPLDAAFTARMLREIGQQQQRACIVIASDRDERYVRAPVEAGGQRGTGGENVSARQHGSLLLFGIAQAAREVSISA